MRIVERKWKKTENQNRNKVRSGENIRDDDTEGNAMAPREIEYLNTKCRLVKTHSTRT